MTITLTKKAFTMIELLVVIGITAVLIALGTYGTTILMKNGRENERMRTINEVKKALEVYYIENGAFPDLKDTSQIEFTNDAILVKISPSKTTTIDLSTNYLATAPLSSKTGTAFCYKSYDNQFTLGYKNENKTYVDIGTSITDTCDDTQLVVGASTPTPIPATPTATSIPSTSSPIPTKIYPTMTRYPTESIKSPTPIKTLTPILTIPKGSLTPYISPPWQEK